MLWHWCRGRVALRNGAVCRTDQLSTLATCQGTVLLVSLNYRVCISDWRDFRFPLSFELICDILSLGCDEYDMLYYLHFTMFCILCMPHALNVRLVFIIIQCLSVIWQCLVNSDWLAMADLLLYLRYWYTKFCRKIVASLCSQLSLLSNVSCLYLKGGGMWGSLLPEGAYLLIA